MCQLIARVLLSVFCFSFLPYASAWLDWQAPLLLSDKQKVKIRFRAIPVEKQNSQHSQEKTLAEPLTIAARPGQTLIVCCQQVTTDNASTLSDVIGETLYQLELAHWKTTLHIKNPSTCANEKIRQLPYDYKGTLYSLAPFLVGSLDNHLSEENSQITGSYRLPAKSNHESSATLNIQTDGKPVACLPVHTWGLRELAEDMTNSRQLLQKLAHRFSDQKAFTRQLLDIVAAGEQNLMDEKSRERIEQQLAAVLKLPDHTFALELEWHGLHTETSPDLNTDKAIFTATGGKDKQQSTTSGMRSLQSQRDSKQTPDVQASHQTPGNPEYNAGKPTSELTAQYYMLEVEGRYYHLAKKTLDGETEQASKVKLTDASTHQSLMLSGLEHNSSIPGTNRIGSHGDVLDYLLHYGTPETLRAFHRQHNQSQFIPEPEIKLISRTLFAALNDRPNIVRLLMKAGNPAPLQCAVEQRLITCTKYLLELGSVTDSFYEDDTTPLHIAVKNQDELMVQLLLDYHANPDSPRASDGITPFHLAIQQGLVTIAQHLHNVGADRYLAASDGKMPWAMIPANIGRMAEEEMDRLTRIKAIDSNDQFELFLKVIEEEDINAVHNFMCEATELLLAGQQQPLRRPLHIAVKTGNPEVVYQLVKVRKAYEGPVEEHSGFYEIVNGVRQSDMCAPLHVAVLKYGETLRTLQEAEETVKVAKQEARANTSNKALEQNYIQAEKEKDLLAKKADDYLAIIDTLLEHSANPDVQRQSDGATPVYLAAERGLLKAVQVLAPEFKKDRGKDKLKAQINQPRRLDKATPLYAAAREGHQTVVEYLLKTKADPNTRTQGTNGKYPLEIALENGHKETARKLADKADQLFNACREGNIEFVRMAIDAGISANTERRGSFALIHLAAEGGNNDIVQLLLQHNAIVDKTYLHGNTALHYAAMYGHLEVAKTLLNHGSEAWAMPNNTQYTPLQQALLNHRRDMACLLIEHEHGASLFVAVKECDDQYLKRLKREGVTTFIIDPETGNTPLHEAVRINRDKCVAALMDESLIEKKNHTGQTPLDLALAKNNRSVLNAFIPFLPSALIKAVELHQPEKVAAILDVGLSPNEQDQTSGEYPLHLAARKGYNDIVKLLLQKQASPDLISDISGITPVDEALSQHHHTTVMLLLDKGDSDAWFSAVRNKKLGLIYRLINAGVSVNRVDSHGETALHKAAKYGNIGVVQLLLSKGADKSLKNRDRKTAYQLARSAGFRGEIVELLDDPICHIL